MKRFVAAMSCAVALVTAGPALALERTAPQVPGPVPPVSADSAATLLERLGLGLPPGPATPTLLPKRQLQPRAVNPGGGDPFPELGPDAYAGYGTGTAFSSDAELSGVGVSVEKAFSTAVYGSESLPARSDEVDRPATPPLDAGHGFGGASAADIGQGEDRLDLPDDISADAPPNRDEAEGEVADVSLLPILHANVLRTKATARSAGDGCVIGSDLASGRATVLRSDVPGEKDDAERPILTISEEDPARALTESRSRVGLLPPSSDDTARFGIFSETRQTIAPVTFLKGTPNEVTVEVAGEWVLRVASDGRTASVSYGPDQDDPLAPVLRIDRRGRDSDVILTAQDIMGSDGEDISTPGVEEFIIGERPRLLGGETGSSPLATGSRVAAAVDVVRLLIPDDREADGLIEVVVGHMEAAVALPAGGISCPGIAMAKEASSAEVEPGDDFTWTVTVANPNECLLDRVSVVDTVRSTGRLEYQIVDTDPEPTRRDGDILTFSGFRPMRMGESFKITVRARMAEDSPPGRFTNDVVSAGACGAATTTGEATGGVDGTAPGGDGSGSKADSVTLTGKVSLAAPTVTERSQPLLRTRTPASAASAGAVADKRVTLGRPDRIDRAAGTGESTRSGASVRPKGLARTGGWLSFGPGLALLALGVAVRQAARRKV